jgi:hypothetical protein
MKRLLVLIFLVGIFSLQKGVAQNRISGYIADVKSGEKVSYATIIIESLSLAVMTDELGYFFMDIPDTGTYNITVQILGYEPYNQMVTVDGDTKMDVKLSSSVQTLDAVYIKGKKKETNKNIKRPEAGKMTLDIKELDKVPVIFGEKDILKTIQLLPGISTAGEGSSGLFVRGGNTDQNLILLDDAPLFSASHLFGFFSVFNSDALKDISVYKAGVPSIYGGRSSSVIDVRMKDGDKKKFHGAGGIGLVSSRFSLEGPIVKEKGSFVISGRRSYIDAFFPLIKTMKGNSVYFYDYNLKANYSINEKNKIFLSGYIGRDVINIKSLSTNLNWGNKAATVRWNHLYSKKLFSNTSAVFSKYDHSISFTEDSASFKLGGKIENISLKQDFTFLANDNNFLKFGFSANNMKFDPGEFTFTDSHKETDTTLTFKTGGKQGLESGLYVQNEQKIGDKFQVNYGLRYSAMHLYGPSTYYDFVGQDTITNKYKKNQFIKNYHGLEPRINSSYQLSNNSSLKGSYSRMFQYIHKISIASSGTPIDYLLPVSFNIKPGITDQVSLGYHRNFSKNKFESFIEVYYKDMKNLIEYKDGADVIVNDWVENQLEFGKGRAYGVELYFKKRVGRFTGWVSYSLSKSERKFENINKNQWYNARQSRTHDVSMVTLYDLTKKIKVSASWVYYTGDAVTFPSGNYEIEGQTIPQFTERNGYRMPNYHRLDLGMEFIFKKKKNYEHSLTVSVYNAYNRKNAYSITFKESKKDPTRIGAYQTSLFPIVPSFTYNFNF